MELVTALAAYLAPFLPVLMKLGGKAAEKGAEKVGEQSAETAGKIWEHLWPKFQAKGDSAMEAAEDVAKNPKNADALGSLRNQLRKILENEPALAETLTRLLEEAKPEAGSNMIQQIVTGNQNQVIGSISGNGKAIGSVTGNVTM